MIAVTGKIEVEWEQSNLNGSRSTMTRAEQVLLRREKRHLGETNRVVVRTSGLVVTQHVGSRCSSRAARNPQGSGGELAGLLISEWKFWKWWEWWK